jgi:fructose-bisphosphate aldolase class I
MKLGGIRIMNEKQLQQMTSKKGFIAALDQSGGSTPKALRLYGIPEDKYSTDDEMFDLVHEMRTRIIKSPSFTGEKIIGAILFEKTIERKIDDKFTADYLWEEKGIVPFLKVDKGLQPEANGVQLMKDIPTLDELLKKGIEKHIFGTKMRSVIKSANEEGIKAIVAQQFDIAKKILSYGLIPIIEPEVDIHSVDKEKCEEILKKEIFANLDKLDKDQKIMLKLTIPSVEGFYSDVIAHDNVLRVVALSGGYTRADSNEKLAKNPGLIASFSRALTEGLNVDQTQKEFDDLLEESIDGIYQASIK